MEIKQLYNYQSQAIEKALKFNKFLIALDMGLGKTFTALSWLKKIKLNNDLNTVIICDSKKINDWQHEAEQLEFKNIIVVVKNENVEIFKNFKNLKNYIFIISYQKLKNIYKNYEVFLHSKLNLIIDESQALKNHSSKISKLMLYINKQVEKLLLLSGDPISNGYENLFIQMKMLEIFKSNYTYYNFLNEYCVTYRFPNKSFEVIKDYKNVNKLMNLLNERAFFLKTEDAIVLPEKTAKLIKINNNDFYKQFKRDKAIISDRWQLSASSSIKFLHDLRMLASGVVKDDLNNLFVVDFAKLNELEKLLKKDNQNNFTIFYNYNAELFFIKQLLKKLNLTTYEINGEKNEIDYALNCNTRFIVLVQYGSGARGIDGLQNKVNNQIYFSLPLSGELFKQSIKRVHRIGQMNKVNYYFLINIQTIESDILQTLRQSKNYTLKLFEKKYWDNKEETNGN
ncbi:SNF2-related protein [Mesomycoplasma lagogenitalium]|uniref:SNF2-related protein n=1 Tax=Mesomycoplasma lagogenitalium TaxID=171286 RepID=A0ABY8LVL4_9BACT|nr:SNF2-related protein [Mesomycoplasma lagogenitalium]WGI36466.1 SNF2-related protein [Mesomycoplasma lagogenitalium]